MTARLGARCYTTFIVYGTITNSLKEIILPQSQAIGKGAKDYKTLPTKESNVIVNDCFTAFGF